MELWSAVATLFRGLFDFKFHPEFTSPSRQKYPVSLKPAAVAKHKMKGKIRQRERPRARKRERQSSES